MKKTLLFMLLCSFALTLPAQKKAPKWMEKGRNAVVTITTYKNDGTELHKGLGFFVGTSGEVLSAYSLFRDAQKATATDAAGNVWPVSLVIGADELYDVIRLQVAGAKKISGLPLATAPVGMGTKAYLLPASEGKQIAFSEGEVTEVSKLKDAYSYYKISFPLEAGQSNAPLLNENGEVFGLAQEDASGRKSNSYAVSAAYAAGLAMSSADIFNTAYSSIGIRKAWPKEADEALVMLYFMAGTQDAKEYLETLNDFIAHFSNTADGYLSRANHYAYNRAKLASAPADEAKMLDQALEDIATAGKLAGKKGEALFNRAKLVYAVSADSTLNNDKWTVAAAEESLREAIRMEDQPVYHQLLGDILFNRAEYEEAYANYRVANSSPTASPASYYMAAKARENMPAANFGELIQLLDSAINRSGITASPEVATYVLERVELRMKLMQYKEAVEDYDRYYTLMGGNVSDAFFYYREQAKFLLGDLAGALQDIGEAIRRNRSNAMYYAEEASVYVRMQAYEKALESVANALRIDPEFAACYRLQGVSYVRQGKKAEACTAFAKAKELGDPVADKLIKEHCK